MNNDQMVAFTQGLNVDFRAIEPDLPCDDPVTLNVLANCSW